MNDFSLTTDIEALINSIKLCGNILVESPTAIPSTPCAKTKGNLTGRLTGSLLRPSYELWNIVVFLSKATSRAKSDNFASIYLGAAALSPVRVSPQLP